MSKKENLINTAISLFLQNGFKATGINEILEKSAISKMTLYKHFKTKDDLIIACLDKIHQEFITNFLDVIEKKKTNPKTKIIELFNMLTTTAKKTQNVRCIFINASAEFPNLDHPAHKAAFQHKLSTQNFLEKQLKKLKIKNHQHKARVLTALTQGALVMSQIGGDKKYYDDCKKTAQILIENAD
ncbi:MAG: TetR/AcrR family transcriptional regulator [Rickettsiales bacterium]|nr:TetR/AcrR family transcriptional regulator [Rickettsiales bacterium]